MEEQKSIVDAISLKNTFLHEELEKKDNEMYTQLEWVKIKELSMEEMIYQ